MTWLDALGWTGSALLLWSMTQSQAHRLRQWNLAACILLTFYNALLHVWPMAVLNLSLTLVNVLHLRRPSASTPQTVAGD